MRLRRPSNPEAAYSRPGAINDQTVAVTEVRAAYDEPVTHIRPARRALQELAVRGMLVRRSLLGQNG